MNVPLTVQTMNNLGVVMPEQGSRYKCDEWQEIAVKGYVDAQLHHRAALDALTDEIARLRSSMEGTRGPQYDRIGSSAGWSDHMAEALDALDAARDRVVAELNLNGEEYLAAVALFGSDEDAQMVWERWGLKTPWKRIAKRRMYVVETCRLRMPKGIAYIYERMPEEYRRSPYGAEA